MVCPLLVQPAAVASTRASLPTRSTAASATSGTCEPTASGDRDDTGDKRGLGVVLMDAEEDTPLRPPATPHTACVAVALAVGLAAALAGIAGARAPAADDFSTWLRALEAEALERGISRPTVESALSDVETIPRVLELDRRQPVTPKDFCGYLELRLTPTRIARGRRVLAEHRELLAELAADYGVPARYLVALWGLETNFGDYLGDYPLIDALVTLALNPRRGDFFREQIFAALQVIDEGHHPPVGLVGSWAGATGQVQLMPTTFLASMSSRARTPSLTVEPAASIF